MAKNDIVLIDGILDQRQKESQPSNDRGEVFELLAIEEILKDYDLAFDEIQNGWVDGRGDGGIDGVYIFVNGHLLDEEDGFPWPRTDASIDLWFITCKHHPTFQQATVEKILATVHELFDLSLAEDDFKGVYSEDLLISRRLFVSAYRRLSIGRPSLRFHFRYASRGDTADLGAEVSSRAQQVETLISELFSSCEVHFRFIGASELIGSHRRTKNFSLALPFLEHLATGQDSYVLLVKLADYWKFVSDEGAQLRRYLFDSNVRDYVGDEGVNEDIAKSLADESAPDFWWLNNGVTILATSATIPGKTIHLQNIQIVNGLQTTETIFRHFQGGSRISYDRLLLVKIIVSSDIQARDRIIRATNNQTPVTIASLHATDKIQRDIEAILEQNGWYYERRINYYRNVGKPKTHFVSPIYLASAYVALVMHNPAGATRLKPKFMRTQMGYGSVFSEELPIRAWPVLVAIYKAVDLAFSRNDLRGDKGERFAPAWRPLMAVILVARRLKVYNHSPAQLLGWAGVEIEFSNNEVQEVWGVIEAVRARRGATLKGKHHPFALECCEVAGEKFGITGAGVIGRRQVGGGLILKRKKTTLVPSPEFIASIDALLPAQPWKPGVHFKIAEEIGADPKLVSSAIQVLIADGRRHLQKDGVVYGRSGEVLAVDPERVVPEDIEDIT